MPEDLIVHGIEWTIKELFVYPNEYIYWSIQIVMYPYMTGLVAGAFVLSSLYHVFGQKDLKEIAQFSLVFSLALLPAAGLPLLLHLQQPTRAMEPLLTPHFTSAISAFGIVFTTYGLIVVSEIWFVYRKFFVEQVYELKGKEGFGNMLRLNVYRVLTMGSFDISEEAQAVDHKAAKILAGVGIGFVSCWDDEGDDLVRLFPPQREWSAPLWLVTHVDLHRTIKVQTLLSHLKSRARDWGGEGLQA